jgi:sodium-type flagellar protein MotY
MLSYWFSRRILCVFCGLCLLVNIGEAQVYAGDYSGTGWAAASTSSSCTMTQELPEFGKAILSQAKGKAPSLVFVLQEKNVFPLGSATINSLPPAWRNDLNSTNLGRLDVVAGKQPMTITDANLVAAVLAQLSDGINVTIHSQPNEEFGIASIVLNAKGFSFALKKYRHCTGEVDASMDERLASYLTYKSSSLGKVILQPGHSSAGGRLFAADIKSSSWKALSNPFVCSMTHDIPEFGKAVFVTKASSSQQFYFELHEKVSFPSGSATIDTFPASWRNNATAIFVTKVVASEGKQPIKLAMADSLLLERHLAKGVSLLFTSEPVSKGVTRVVLDAKHFLAENKRYKQCIDDLIPFTFAQIARLVFNYSEKSDGLTSEMKTDLSKLIRYMKADQSILGVLIDAHSDNARAVDASDALTKKHAEWVGAFLREKGIGADRIAMRWHGDKYPLANNDTPEGRVKNRRLTVRVETQSTRSHSQKKSAEKKIEDQKKAVEVAAEKEKAEAQKKIVAEQKTDKSIQKNAQDALKAARTQSADERVTPDDIHKLVEGLELIEKQK